jgi:hypothetical protein
MICALHRPKNQIGLQMIKEKVRIRYSFRGGFRKVTTKDEEFFDNSLQKEQRLDFCVLFIIVARPASIF